MTMEAVSVQKGMIVFPLSAYPANSSSAKAVFKNGDLRGALKYSSPKRIRRKI